MHDIVKMIDDATPHTANPAVYISGGLDSTIVLHHVCEKAIKPVYTFTARFNVETDECEHAAEVAKHYGTIHTEVQITNLIERMPEILKIFDRPRYNFWIY